MNALDWIILAAALVLAVYGYGRGFIVGALSLAGFAAGAFLGTRLGPQLLAQGSSSPYAPAFGLVGALLGGAILATGLEGVGARLRRALILPGLSLADGLLGAALSACLALGAAWIVAAVALQAPGNPSLRADIQRSAILQGLNALLPTEAVLNALARFDPLPSLGLPVEPLAAPPAGIARLGRVRAAEASVVRVLGTACGLGIEGSGWVAAPGLVVTNAHVIAGESDTTVQVGGRPPGLPATVVGRDVRNDLAVLRVAGLDAPSLALAGTADPGEGAAIMGYPRNGPFDVRDVRVGATRTVVTQDAYGRGPVTRAVTTLRGLVRPGNSGGPVIDTRGHVAATVFAATVGGGPHGGYGVPLASVEHDLASVHGPVSSGSCAS